MSRLVGDDQPAHPGVADQHVAAPAQNGDRDAVLGSQFRQPGELIHGCCHRIQIGRTADPKRGVARQRLVLGD